MHVAPQAFLGNLETTVILVRAAQLYIVESQESLHLDATLFVQQSCVMCPGKTGMALKDEQLMAIRNVYNGKDVLVWLPMDKASPLLHMYELLPLVFLPRICFEMA